MERVKVALGNRGMTVEAARRCARDRIEWRALVHLSMIKFHAAILHGSCVPSDRPPVLLGLIYLERDGMPLPDGVGINCKKGATT